MFYLIHYFQFKKINVFSKVPETKRRVLSFFVLPVEKGKEIQYVGPQSLLE
jgi:hypothetical protein